MLTPMKIAKEVVTVAVSVVCTKQIEGPGRHH
jgi:hypothetical protein